MVTQVEGGSLQCARNHGGAHYGEGISNRVQQLDAVTACIICCQQHFIVSVSLDEAVGHHFAQACAYHVILYVVLYIVQHRLAALGDGQLRLMAFDEIIAMHTRNFFADIGIAVDVTAPGRSGNQQLAVLCFYTEAQFAKNSNHFVLSNVYADAAVNLCCGSGDYCRLQLFRISFYDTAEGFAGTHFFQQVSSTVQCVMVADGINTTLKTAAGFTAQAQRTGGAADRRTVEGSSLQNNVLGFVGNLSQEAAHNTTKTGSLFGITDGNHCGGQLALLAVEGNELFAFLSTAHNQSMACNLIGIISMHRLAQLQHNIVGNVNYVADGAHAAGTQTALHPFGRRHDFDILQHAGSKAGAQLWCVNFNVYIIACLTCGSFLNVHSGHFQRATGDSADFARQTDNAEAVGTVAGQVDIDNGIIQA